MSRNSRMSNLLARSLAVASVESDVTKVDEAPTNPDDLIDTETGKAGGSLDTIEACQNELNRPAVVSVEEAELAADLVVAEADLDAGNDSAAELQSVEGGLNRTADFIEGTLPEGGMTPEVAEAVQISVDVQRERLGVDEEVMPATESFGGESTRYNATVASLESVKELAGRVGTAIKDAIARIRAFLSKMFTKLMEFLFSIETRNKDLERKLKAATGAKVVVTSEQRIDLGELHARINIGGKVDIADLKKVAGVIKSAVLFDAETMKMLNDEYVLIQRAVSGQAGTISDAQLRTEMPPVFTGAFSKADGAAEYQTAVLPGNVRFQIVRNEAAAAPEAAADDGSLTRAKKVIQTIKAQLSAGFKVVRVDDTEGKEADGAAPVLTPAQVQEVINVVAEIAASKKDAGNAKELKGMNFKDLTIPATVDAADVAGLTSLIAKFSSRIAVANQATAKVVAYGARCAAAYQTYAFKSVAQYGTKKTSGGA